MCKTGGQVTGDDSLPVYGWDEIRKHATKTEQWIVIEGYVYDVTRWAKKHPGGQRMLTNQAGQDSTVSYVVINVPSLVFVGVSVIVPGLPLGGEDSRETAVLLPFL